MSGIKTITDPVGDEHFAIFAPFVATDAAISRGDVVCMDGSGDVIASATANLSRVVGVASNDAAVGEIVMVQIYGYCDYVTTDGDLATSDLALQALDGGVAGGVTEAEIAADGTLGFHIFARGLGVADTGTVGTCFITAMGANSGTTDDS